MPRQFGFRPKLSTEDALTHFTDLVLENMDKSLVTGAVFLDLSKAFDTVDHLVLFSKLSKAGLEDNLNTNLKCICNWLNDNLLTLNVDKCKFVIFRSTPRISSFSNLLLEINGIFLERNGSFKYLGVKLSQNMSWSEHIDALSKKVCQRLGVLRRVEHLLPLHSRFDTI